MAGFIYYIPGRSGLVKSAEYPALGLSHIATKGEPECRDCRSGPDGTGGVLIVPQHPSAPESLFKPTEQTWRKAPGGKWWVGYFNDRRPGPADLDRQTMTEGTAVHLADGNDWIIPRAYAVLPDRPRTLPMTLDVNEEGQWIGRITQEHEKLSREAMAYFIHWIGEDKKPFMRTRALDLAELAMAVGYRLSRVEIGLLGLMTEIEARLVLRALIDADEIEAHAKKNSPPADSSISSGVMEKPA